LRLFERISLTARMRSSARRSKPGLARPPPHELARFAQIVDRHVQLVGVGRRRRQRLGELHRDLLDAAVVAAGLRLAFV
jgi:hypothetical protein